MNTDTAIKGRTYDMAYTAVFTVIIVICSWISIPLAVPFTLQTFGIFAAIGTLGGKRGTCAIAVYILLGVMGIPVFSGFNGGIGVLLANTGGYILGFLFSGLIAWGMEALFGRSSRVLILSMALGLLVCYIFGTAWFMFLYTSNTGSIGIGTVLSWCVLPFILPDIIKIALAFTLSKKFKKML